MERVSVQSGFQRNLDSKDQQVNVAPHLAHRIRKGRSLMPTYTIAQ